MANHVSTLVAIVSVLVALANTFLVIWSRRSLARIDQVKVMETTFDRQLDFLNKRVEECEKTKQALMSELDKIRERERERRAALESQLDMLASERDRMMRRILQLEGEGGRKRGEPR